MSNDDTQAEGPDCRQCVELSSIADGAMLSGHIDGQPALLVRRGETLFAVGAKCTHYGGPLGDGIVIGETIRCPWHHACFDLNSGEVLRARAIRCRGGASSSATELPTPGKGSSASPGRR